MNPPAAVFYRKWQLLPRFKIGVHCGYHLAMVALRKQKTYHRMCSLYVPGRGTLYFCDSCCYSPHQTHIRDFPLYLLDFLQRLTRGE